MQFEFIDSNVPIDPSSRQRIRRQAARGKNLGRTITRPSRKDAAARKPQQQNTKGQALQPHGTDSRAATTTRDVSAQVTPHQRDDAGIAPQRSASESISPPPQVGDGFSLLRLPQRRKVGSDRTMQQAMHFILHAPHAMDVGGKALDTAGPHEISRLLFLDEAYFHSAMALSMAALDERSGLHPEMVMNLAMQHLSHSLHIITERFTTGESVSDANIAAVVTLTHFERMTGHADKGRMHFDGLERMITLRQGIEKLSPSLVEKILRADLSYAMHFHSKTRFTVEQVAIWSASATGRGAVFSVFDREREAAIVQPEFLAALSPEYRALLLDGMNLARILDEADEGKRARIPVRNLHMVTILMGYKLLRSASRPGGLQALAPIDLLVHIGIASFGMTFFRSFDNKKITGASGLSRAAMYVIDALDGEDVWVNEVLLWMLFLGSVIRLFEVGDGPAWLYAKVEIVCSRLVLREWKEVATILAKFPWSRSMFGLDGQTLWTRVWEHSTRPEPARANLVLR